MRSSDLLHCTDDQLQLLRGHVNPDRKAQQHILHLIGDLHGAHETAILETCRCRVQRNVVGEGRHSAQLESPPP